MTSFHLPESVSPDALVEAAIAEAGGVIDDFDGGLMGGDTISEPLGLLCDALAQPDLRKGGRHMLAAELVRYLANRLRIIDWHQRNPAARDTTVEAPVVILGLPRTGTTAVSYLLDQDTRWRSLLNWEAVFSVPPPTAATLRTDPRCLELLEFQRAIVDTIDPPPPHWEWADGPTECTFVLAGDLRSVMWESRVPDAAYYEWLMADRSAAMTSAYRYHRLVLQTLGSQTAGRWVLKMPAHALFVDALLAEYPDARIVWTHRDPVAVTASFLNLTAFSQGLTFGEPRVDAQAGLDRLVEQVNRPMWALAGCDVFHLHYDHYLVDPLAMMRELYDWLGEQLEETAATAMQGWLDADPLAVSRRSRSTLHDFGLDESDVRRRFGEYVSMFDVNVT